ncbi:helix-turn-helix domain-containing protein [Paraburkholderia sp.]|uniref:helix-turn-helix domain-containing protein n=1 Tax=Paraburkholderia sp. TaxID=1926495 RepID=UPI003C738980
MPKERYDFDAEAFHRRLGGVIWGIRNQRGLTQKQLAGSSRLSSQYLGNLERGTVNASVDSLLRVCKALSIPLSELILRAEAD